MMARYWCIVTVLIIVHVYLSFSPWWDDFTRRPVSVEEKIVTAGLYAMSYVICGLALAYDLGEL